jgi:hypothetical protein
MGVLALQVLGRGGVPASGVSSVVLNVTVTAPTAPGFVAAYPDGSPVPTASNVNFVRGQTVPNLVVAQVGADGKVDLLNHSAGTTQLVADVSGYFVGGSPADAGTYTPVLPARLMDTRIGLGAATLAPGAGARLVVDGHAGVPSTGVAAVVMNVTVTRPTARGVITVYPDGTARPGSSNLNYSAGQTVPNLVAARVGADGAVDFWNTSSGSTDLIADVQGYVSAGSVTDPGVFVPVGPSRALDTRIGLGGVAVGPHKALSLQVAGRAGVPAAELRAVALNVTVTGTVAPGFVTVYPDGTPLPTASNLNFVAGQTVPNLVIVRVGPDGRVDLYNGSSNTVQLVADVAGYFNGVFGEPAAGCAGFSDATGITDDTVSIANASDVTGPVPNLYAAAQQATKAYAAYFDAGADLCGRTLGVDALDTQTSASGDDAAAVTACGNDFAMVGSMAQFDGGGAATSAGCGIPDVRARPSSVGRQYASDTYAASYGDLEQVPAVVPTYFVQNDPDAVGHAAFVYVNAGNWPAEAHSEMSGWTQEGFTVVSQIAIDVSAFDYTPYVSALEAAGVRYVQFVGPSAFAVRFAQEMQAQRFAPLFVVDPLTADADFLAAGGADVDGAYTFDNAPLFTDTPVSHELALYEHWLQVVAPGAVPSYVGLYAWSAVMLFTQQALALGGRLSRASLIAALGNVHGWTGNGLHAAQDVGGRTTAGCDAVVQVSAGQWVRRSGGQYLCGAVVVTQG